MLSMYDAPTHKFILVYSDQTEWVKAKWVEHAQMFSLEDPNCKDKFYPLVNPRAWEHLPEKPNFVLDDKHDA